VFCDVAGSTEVRSRLGDAAADVWFEHLLRALGDSVMAADGVVIKSLGDGVMAVFTSASAALSGAVGMQHAAFSHGHVFRDEPASLRVGVSIGDVAQLEDDWNGMPVVESARLCAAAGNGEILAAEVVRMLAGSRSDHTFSAAAMYDLKGIPEPVSAVRVEWSPPEQTSAGRALPAILELARRGPFVGRESLVADCLYEWKVGAWRTLLVAGEPGIGKTRFVSELCARCVETGAAVVVGRCDEDIAGSYRPWTEALDSFVQSMDLAELDEFVAQNGAELSLIAPSLRRRLVDLPPIIDADAVAMQGLVIDAVIAFVSRIAIEQPLVIVLDDIHWIDPASLVVLRRLAAIAPTGVTFVATYRDTDLDRVHPLSAALADLRRVDGVRRVALDGLDASAVEDFLTVAAGHALDAEALRLAEAVHTETAGNPLFVGEMLRHLAESGFIRREDDRWVGNGVVSLPEGLREVIGRRLTRLGESVCAALRIGAVIGRSFEPEVIEAVLERDVLDELEVAAAAGIIVDTGRLYEFRHAVLREVLLSELSSARRQRLHRDIVAVLESRWALSVDNHLEELAHHHCEARSSQAAFWCLRAAQSAIELFRFEEAIAWAERGLELLDLADSPDPALRCDLLIALAGGWQWQRIDDTFVTTQIAFEAASRLGDLERMAKALLTAGLPTTGGLAHDHIAFMRSALAQLGDFSSNDRWLAEGFLIGVELVGPNLTSDEHHHRVEHILAHLDASGAYVAHRLAVGYVLMTEPLAAKVIFDRFGDVTGNDHKALVFFKRYIAQMHLSLADRTTFDSMLDQFERDVGGTRFWLLQGELGQSRAMQAMLDGNWEAATGYVARVREVAPNDGNFALGCQTQDSWIAREIGNVEAQFRSTTELQQLLPDFPVLKALAVSDAAEAGHHDEALAALDALAPNDFAAVGRGWTGFLAFASLAWATITVDARQHAPVLRRLIAPYAGLLAVMVTGTHVVCAVDRLLAGLAALEGEHDEADRLFAAALALEESVQSPPLVARTRHWWARALVRRGDVGRAQPLIAAALDTANELGMLHLVVQLNELAASV
jgi:hypothetical protein